MLLLMSAVLICASHVNAGSCREARLCCPGRDSSCVVQNVILNTIMDNRSEKPCYCDHACVKLGDCCTDFKDVCEVQDCIVSEWDEWSACNVDCGQGTKFRSRRILHPPKDNGKRCPILIQTRACHVTVTSKCESSSNKGLSVSAILMPASLLKTRTINTTENEENKNITYQKGDSFHNEYCVDYELVKVSKSCRNEPSFKQIQPGTKLRVKCEREALRRDQQWRCVGDNGQHFTSLSSPHCHGIWKRLSTHNSDVCRDSIHYVFV